eukprot:gnl/MRDRNA2_/MRDRNA2_28113_c0_seq1.p1 gnl/MRDRNA2_/MRDRNA2_28113_c0~~gnl/MRDRNA2_/MRDRNA2_28113_c0_seq1.p1  ORF type:complete len:164 (-),score=10.32 gnl/MRDRNA2_/MRDRNA2_28113_c0_seq1:296-787(-)
MADETVGGKGGDMGAVDVGKLIPCNACCCLINSLYCKFPDCCGCKSEGQFLCVSSECVCCKPLTQKNDDDKFCICFEGGSYFMIPKTCCLGSSQVLCVDTRCAYPCVAGKVPCLFTFLPFCVCCADSQVVMLCGKNVDSILAKAAEKRGGKQVAVAPTQQQMS